MEKNPENDDATMGQEFQYLRLIQIFYVNSLCPRNANTRHANMYTTRIWQYSRANKHFGIYKKKEKLDQNFVALLNDIIFLVVLNVFRV